jgi:hypothetical protein
MDFMRAPLLVHKLCTCPVRIFVAHLGGLDDIVYPSARNTYLQYRMWSYCVMTVVCSPLGVALGM